MAFDLSQFSALQRKRLEVSKSSRVKQRDFHCEIRCHEVLPLGERFDMEEVGVALTQPSAAIFSAALRIAPKGAS